MNELKLGVQSRARARDTLFYTLAVDSGSVTMSSSYTDNRSKRMYTKDIYHYLTMAHPASEQVRTALRCFTDDILEKQYDLGNFYPLKFVDAIHSGKLLT